jgi:hypothetical protein
LYNFFGDLGLTFVFKSYIIKLQKGKEMKSNEDHEERSSPSLRQGGARSAGGGD